MQRKQYDILKSKVADKKVSIFEVLGCRMEVLQELLREFPPQVAADENEFQVRVAFFGLIDPPARLEILAARRAVLEQRLAHVQGLIAGGGRERNRRGVPPSKRR